MTLNVATSNYIILNGRLFCFEPPLRPAFSTCLSFCHTLSLIHALGARDSKIHTHEHTGSSWARRCTLFFGDLLPCYQSFASEEKVRVHICSGARNNGNIQSLGGHGHQWCGGRLGCLLLYFEKPFLFPLVTEVSLAGTFVFWYQEERTNTFPHGRITFLSYHCE